MDLFLVDRCRIALDLKCARSNRSLLKPTTAMKRQRQIEESIAAAPAGDEEHEGEASVKQRKKELEPDPVAVSPSTKGRARSQKGRKEHVETAAAAAEATWGVEQGAEKMHDAAAAAGRAKEGRGRRKGQQQQQQPIGEEEKQHRATQEQQQEGTTASDEAAGNPSVTGLPENAIEKGHVFFMYKPTVGTAEGDVSSLRDVQRFYLLLQPESPPGGSCRIIVIGKKKLPDPKRHERYFGFVEATASTTNELTPGMTQQQYTTKTRGERTQPAARAAGEAQYIIAVGGKRGGTHLAYRLELPEVPGKAQQVLGINKEGSFVISVKNPDNKGRGPRGVPSAGPEPQYTEEQREQFGKHAWIGVEDRSLLDVAGTELLLVGAKADPVEAGELGEAGEVLGQASDEEADRLQKLDQQQQKQHLQKALIPKKSKTRQRQQQQQLQAGSSIPVDPAVTGELK